MGGGHGKVLYLTDYPTSEQMTKYQIIFLKVSWWNQ